ncbi:squalene/phytoene synthase family protein [Candidatus Pelagibacter sp.]|nr:squalene/phytoene synthase family protein [Candidatus Pelagibacter sp.]
MSNNLISTHAKSFSWAGFFLAKQTFENGSSLYDFCRTLDDIADENISLDLKKQKFNKMKKDFIDRNLENILIKNIYNLIKKFNISEKIVLDLFDGIESDIKESIEFKTRQELLVYSYRVAGTVGLMMAKILKVDSKIALRSAVDLGIAMQLTNIARDVVEDSGRNRKYIDHDFIKIKETLGIAELFYKSSFKSIKEIPLINRFAILVARRVYREIGNNILKKKDLENYNKSGKIFVNKIGKIKQTIFSIFDLFILIFSKSDIHLTNEEHMEISKEINLNERF